MEIVTRSKTEAQEQSAEHKFVCKCIPLQAGIVEIPRLVLQGVSEHDQVSIMNFSSTVSRPNER